jgi:hypothetical protein
MLSFTLDCWMVAGARIVAGVETTVVVAAAGSLFAGEVAGLCCVTAFEVAGPVAGLDAGCVVVSSSLGNGARVSDGSAFAADGISTLGEFVVTGTAGFSFFASGCEAGGCVVVSVVDFGGAISGAFGFLFNAMAGIGLGSIVGGTVSVLAASFGGVTGAAATFCGAWSQPTS